MTGVVPLPGCDEVFLDARGVERVLRASWNHDDDIVVLSLWREDNCVATFQLPAEDVLEFVRVLVAGLAEPGPVRLSGQGRRSPSPVPVDRRGGDRAASAPHPDSPSLRLL